jgi:2-keto-4-pentenoate hydratase/2-oxohepta-3-ene-1,7-dioic acid hydratase in catechol pathway
MIVHVSKSETLYAGELFGSGTIGDGSGQEHGIYLSPGDVIELDIEKIGVLRNRVVKK